MLIRVEGDQAILITQPAHAWVSGQIARAWGNDRYSSFGPREAVCLAASLHDIGWVAWEASPTLNPETGLPHSFREMPRETHIDLWSRARRYALDFGRYPALLVSMHGTGLFERFGPGPEAPESVRTLVDRFMDAEHAEQQRLIDHLSADPHYAPYVQPDVLEANRRLIGLWDGMSLSLCGGLDPSGVTIGDFKLTPAGSSNRVGVDPWPFAADTVTLSVDGRYLPGRCETQDELDAALAEADWTTLEFELTG